MYTYSISAGEDYIGGPYSVVFPPGVNVVSINVPIIDDEVAELTEEFFVDLEIPPAAAALRVVEGSPDSATVNIMDDDSEYL